MSTRCAVQANIATMRPSMNVGDTTTRSYRWPVPFHGSLVTNTSPSRICATGNTARKCPTERAIVLMCPGVPVTACANIRPCRSNAPAEISPASRDDVLNAVRTSVCACSSTTDSSRFHMICSSISEILRAVMA